MSSESSILWIEVDGCGDLQHNRYLTTQSHGGPHLLVRGFMCLLIVEVAVLTSHLHTDIMFSGHI